jgi:hypothetical protein
MSKDKARKFIVIMDTGCFVAVNILHDLNNLFIKEIYFIDKIGDDRILFF